jgi:hypothetical protein
MGDFPEGEVGIPLLKSKILRKNFYFLLYNY